MTQARCQAAQHRERDQQHASKCQSKRGKLSDGNAFAKDGCRQRENDNRLKVAQHRCDPRASVAGAPGWHGFRGGNDETRAHELCLLSVTEEVPR
jgi:hypothetical protein